MRLGSWGLRIGKSSSDESKRSVSWVTSRGASSGSVEDGVRKEKSVLVVIDDSSCVVLRWPLFLLGRLDSLGKLPGRDGGAREDLSNDGLSLFKK